jgi:hypothetical protein
MENIKEQFARLYMELDLTDDQAAMIKKLQRDVDAALRQPPVIGSVCDKEKCKHWNTLFDRCKYVGKNCCKQTDL